MYSLPLHPLHLREVSEPCSNSRHLSSDQIIELEYQLRNSEAKLILVGQEQIPVALKAATKAGLTHNNVYLFCEPEEGLATHSSYKILPWTKIWRPIEEARSWSWRKIDTLKEAEETTAIINYSSGHV